MLSEKTKSNIVTLALLVASLTIIISIIYMYVSRPKLVEEHEVTSDTIIRITKYDPNPGFFLDYVDLNTGIVETHYAKRCSYDDSKLGIKVGNVYKVRIVTKYQTFDDGAKLSYIATNGCDILSQIPIAYQGN